MISDMIAEQEMPKTIHYCWYGRGPKPEVFYKCLESWKSFMPGWKIIEWNESNTDLSFCQFLKDAYDNKKWAFVSDVVRLKAVYEYGGIYLDTDVELYSSLESLMCYNLFMFFQNHNQLNTGLGFGARKNNSLIKRMLDYYTTIPFSADNLNDIACPAINTAVVKRELPEVMLNNTTQNIDENLFISFETYCALAHHYGAFSWKSEDQAKALKYSKSKRRFWKLRKVLRNPSIFSFFEKNNLRFLSKIYGFCVYDLIDYGILYWIIRVIQRCKKKK